MKPVIIDSKFIKRELFVLLGCFAGAVIFDLVGIIKFSRPLVELVQTIGYEITITVVLYLIVGFFRVIIHLFR